MIIKIKLIQFKNHLIKNYLLKQVVKMMLEFGIIIMGNVYKL